MRLILGVDEAGRGPLAGPLAVGTIAVPEGTNLLEIFPGLNDSKQLSEEMRERIFGQLEESVLRGEVRFHVQLVGPKYIDTEGLTEAIGVGVRSGVRMLLPNPSLGKVFLDGSLKAPEEYDQETIIKGDTLIPEIMLASIAAKVTRDRRMVQLGHKYPQYGFEIHKGYGTEAHYQALREHGPCKIHRQLFLRKFNNAMLEEKTEMDSPA